MIQSLKLQNFQTHRDLQLSFDQITTITGPSDAGKSSIIRALIWAMTNDVAGDFTTWGETTAKAELVVDGKTVVRKKGKGVNYYSIDAKDPYDAVGRDVPRDVTDILNVGPVNFQSQLDAHFWLSETPGEVAKQLNRVVELSAIDDATSTIASEIRTTTAKKKLLEERLEAAKAKRTALRWVEEASAEYAAVTEARTRADALRDRAAKLARSIDAVTTAARDRDVAGNAVVDGREVLRAWERADELRRLAVTVRDQLAKVETAERVLTDTRAELADKKAILSQEKICPLCSQKLP